jgi:hypoxanthine phosphoribosyltransferase
MDKIKLHDKTFHICIPNEKIEENIKNVADQINKDYKDAERPLFLSVLSGSFMFTASLLKHINFDCEISFIKLSSYCGTSSTGEVRQILGYTKPLKGRNVIVVEDIVDSGDTMVEMNKILMAGQVKDARICTLLLKPDAYKKDLKIDYVAMRIPNDFIVGFGLDYDELGRQYKDIYVLDD